MRDGYLRYTEVKRFISVADPGYPPACIYDQGESKYRNRGGDAIFDVTLSIPLAAQRPPATTPDEAPQKLQLQNESRSYRYRVGVLATVVCWST
jgi:hypothetical protein